MVTTSAHFAIPFLCLLPATLCLTLKNHCVHVSSFRGRETRLFPPMRFWSKSVVPDLFHDLRATFDTRSNPPKKIIEFVSILIKQLGPVNDWRGRCARPPLEWCCSYAQTSRGDLHGSNVGSFSSFSMSFFMCWNRVKKILTPLHLTTNSNYILLKLKLHLTTAMFERRYMMIHVKNQSCLTSNVNFWGVQ